MIRIGIDPGKNGYICVIDKSDLQVTAFGTVGIAYYPMPLIGDALDIVELSKFFNTIAYQNPTSKMHCVIEDVHALFGASAKATFNFGWIVGVMEALLVANEIPYTKITPKNWQKEMWEGIPIQKKVGKNSTDTKAMSLLAAKRLFPNEDLRATERCTKAHDGKVDALLLAEYARRKF